jgi:predicted DNA-binding protein with PD1-like motif
MLTIPIRLKAGNDLKKEIENVVNQYSIKAGWIACCVGSLTNYNIRYANRKESNAGSGHFEILSLSGTLSTNGCHLHISISNSDGETFGGHLLNNNIIYTTAEIIIQHTNEFIFKRELDPFTSFNELVIQSTK